MDVLGAAKLSMSPRRPRYLSQSCGAAQSMSMPPPRPAIAQLPSRPAVVATIVNNVLRIYS